MRNLRSFIGRQGVLVALGTAIVAVTAMICSAQLGEQGTPMLPNQPYHVHGSERPHPKVITPGTESTQSQPGKSPSDAIVLFDGKDLSKWVNRRGRTVTDPATWKVENGYVEVVKGAGDLLSKEKFGSIQLHLEWASPAVIEGGSQGRGNSGVLFMER